MRWGQWPAFWIAPARRPDPPCVVFYRRVFEVPQAATLRLHVSADERYVLWLDGERLGRGPETGDTQRWFYDSYEITLRPGRHEALARVFSLGDLAIFPQVSLAHGFLLAAEDAAGDFLNTGVADWDCARAENWRFHPNAAGATWCCEEVCGTTGQDGELAALDLTWAPAVRHRRARSREAASYEWAGDHPLHPSGLPAQSSDYRGLGRVIHIVSEPFAADSTTVATDQINHQTVCPGWRPKGVPERIGPLDRGTATGARARLAGVQRRRGRGDGCAAGS